MADIERDPLFELITDALRAGPGSPAWREAVSRLRAEKGEGSEYELLYAARERLESGKPWRSIGAGPGFTRKVMEAIEREPAGEASRWPTALLISILALAILTGLIVGGIYLAGRSSPTQQEFVADLNGVYFSEPIATATFDGDIPPGWSYIGSLPLSASGDLNPTTFPSAVNFLGGGIVCDTPAPKGEPFCAEAQLRIEKPSDDLIPQVFVTDDNSFSEDRGTSPHELVWLVNSDGMRIVLPDGHVADVNQRVQGSQEPQLVRILVGKEGAIVEFAGKRIWSGAHQLRPDRPWYVGVRFLAKSAGGSQRTMFQSVRLLKAKK